MRSYKYNKFIFYILYQEYIINSEEAFEIVVLERLLKSLDIRVKDTKGRNVLHHGAIHGAFNKKLVHNLLVRDKSSWLIT